MVINRTWQMPNKNTFSIKPIREIINKYAFGTITNDLNPEYNTDYHLEATDFLKVFEDGSVDTVLYDPPFSPRQLSESYKQFGLSVNMETTQASYWAKQKEQIGRIVKPCGIVITCGWNSGGIGKNMGLK